MLKKQLPYALWSLGAACALVWGFLLERNRDLSMTNLKMYAAILVVALVAFAACRGFSFLVDKCSRPVKLAPLQPCGLRTTLLLGAILLCGWIPVLLASWPGYFCYDMVHVAVYVVEGTLNDQQPLFHTILCGSIVRTGIALFGSWNAGVALYTCLQICLLTALALFTLRCLSSLGFSQKMLVGCAIYYAINPAVALLCACSTKDVIFSFCLMCFCVLLMRALRYGEAHKHLKRDCVLMGILLFVVLAYRGNVLYALVATVPFAAFFMRKIGRRVLVLLCSACGIAVLCFLVWKGPVANALSAEHSDARREMISIPTMEIARCARFDDWGQAEFESLGLDRDSLANQYFGGNYHSSDGIRTTFWPLIDEGRLGDILGLWMRARQSHFSQCVVADLELTEAAWYVGAVEDGYTTAGVGVYDYSSTPSNTFAAWCEPPAYQESLLPWLSDLIWRISRYDTMQDQPVSHLLLSVASYLWLFLLVLARGFETGDIAIKTAGMLLLLITGTLFLGPIVLWRYYYFLALLLPPLLGLVFLRPKEEQLGKHFA